MTETSVILSRNRERVQSHPWQRNHSTRTEPKETAHVQRTV